MSISCRNLRVTRPWPAPARGGLPGGRRRRDGGRARSERRGEVDAAAGARPPRRRQRAERCSSTASRSRRRSCAPLSRPCCSAPSCNGPPCSTTPPPACGCGECAGPRARRLARPWLDALGIAHLADRHARTLSGGEVQRVAIARALAVRSRVLLLDEPFAGLDATTRADLIADLRTALDHSTAAVLLVTHDRDEAAALAHRTALLLQGRIRQLGTTADVLDSPADLECARLLGYTTHLPPELTGHDVLLVARPERCRLVVPGGAPRQCSGGRLGHAAPGRPPGGNHAGRRRHRSGTRRRPDHHRGDARTRRSAARHGRRPERPGMPTPGCGADRGHGLG